MKTIITLFCFYFIGTVSLPCPDINGIDKSCKSENNCSDTHDQQDECRTFCSCLCCSSVTDEHMSLKINVPFKMDIHPPVIISLKFSIFMPAIWQPPKFV